MPELVMKIKKSLTLSLNHSERQKIDYIHHNLHLRNHIMKLFSSHSSAARRPGVPVPAAEKPCELSQAEGRRRCDQPQQQGHGAEWGAVRLPALQLQSGSSEEGVRGPQRRGIQGRSSGGGRGQGRINLLYKSRIQLR